MTFAKFIQRAKQAQRLVVQPRVGFAQLDIMHQSLLAIKQAQATMVGTITVDAYTRVGDHETARRALREGRDLNGFPIVAHGGANTRQMLRGIQDENFPIQVRHGCPLPHDIFVALIEAGVDATEGGPVSYCLPYGRTPLSKAIEAWRRCCDLLVDEAEHGHEIHLESFGGCMLGQLCPPELLIALSVLECIFFQSYGVRSVSMSYTQGTNLAQDIAALRAMRRLAEEFLHVDWHLVLYTYMGVFPKTVQGANDLILDSIFVAVKGGAERVIVKTPAEAHRIPTVAENMGAVELAAHYAQSQQLEERPEPPTFDVDIYAEAHAIVVSVLELDSDISHALAKAFKRGFLDVPFCVHADNAKRARSFIDTDGSLRWLNVGGMAISGSVKSTQRHAIKAYDLLSMLSYVQQKFDQPYMEGQNWQTIDGPSKGEGGKILQTL